MSDLILRVTRGESVEKTPVWMMRQAGRYLPEFREIRASFDFFTCCTTPSLAAKITLQPLERYGSLLDCGIIFSDILVIPQALGLEVQMLPNVGPHFPSPLSGPDDLSRLHKKVDVQASLGYVFEAIRETKRSITVPLIGFCGAPWTLMAYMIEGGGSKTFSKAKKWLWMYPEASHTLLSLISKLCVEYIVGQIDAGAQLIQLFDSWAGELAPHLFRLFSLPYLTQIARGVRLECQKRSLPTVPLIIFAKGALSHSVCALVDEFDVISLDWCVDVEQIKEKIRAHVQGKRKVILQGNLDPICLYAPHAVIRSETELMLSKFLGRKDLDDFGYICNLGHGILPDIDTESVKVFLETVDSVSRRLLQ